VRNIGPNPLPGNGFHHCLETRRADQLDTPTIIDLLFGTK